METDAQLPANSAGGEARGAGMSPAELVAALRDPARYPHPAEAVELIETHISWVFLAGEYAYKVKKPVNLGFLDFSTLQARRFYCEEELRLNRRTAPELYLGVVPIACARRSMPARAPMPSAGSFPQVADGAKRRESTICPPTGSRNSSSGSPKLSSGRPPSPAFWNRRSSCPGP
jgi:hypothetical protein